MRQPSLLFLSVWAIYTLCPPFPSFDSYWTVPVAVSILDRGDTDIDEYLPRMPAGARYAVECVAPGKPAVRYLDQPTACAEGHAYNFYSLAVSILILPLVAVLKLAVRLPIPAQPFAGRPMLAAFLSGDFYAGHAVVELLCAALICALAVVVMERVLAEFLPPRMSLFLALVLAFGTGVWSTASRSLYQHGPLMLLFHVALLLLVKGQRDGRWIRYASLPLAACYTLRPTGAIWVAVITVFVWVHHRKHFPAFLIWALPVALPFLTYNLMARNSLLPAYFTMSTAVRPFSYFESLATHLVSPSRGLFVSSPFFVASILGGVMAIRTRWMFPLLPYLLAATIAYALVSGAWWPGHSYASRYLTDIAPVLVLLLIPVFEWWRDSRRPIAAAVFAVALAWSVFVHGHGATSVAAHEWNSRPSNIDSDPQRVWDWRDPQFLRFH